MNNPELAVDAVLVVIILIALFDGWRQGAIASFLSAIGIASGLVVGLAITPFILELTDDAVVRLLLGLGVIVALVILGNVLGSVLGASVRDMIRHRATQWWDSLFGAIFQVTAVMLVCWLISVPLAAGPGKLSTEGIANSRVLRVIDEIAPDELNRLPSRVAAMLNESGLPPLVSPFVEANAHNVAAPDPNVVNDPLIESVRSSVVHVVGDAEECKRRLMGSGFVTAADYVITNAHVVAGTASVHLDTAIGMKDATVVYFNPLEDIAVLYSPQLGLPALPWAEDAARTGADAIVLGHPESGPFNAEPARIADRILISGNDIYARNYVEREAYSVRGSIREGNSGGPLITTSGQVLGVVFGASRDDSHIGFALTAAEVRKNIGDVTALKAPVNTQHCVIG